MRSGKAITDAHFEYQDGCYSVLANDPSVPSAFQADVASYGLCADEFQTDCYVNSLGVPVPGWPPWLYVREASRLIGQYVVTQADLFGQFAQPDSIATAGYHADCHLTRRYPTGPTSQAWEGDLGLPAAKLWKVPLRAIQPKEVTNLLVPVALSASRR